MHSIVRSSSLLLLAATLAVGARTAAAQAVRFDPTAPTRSWSFEGCAPLFGVPGNPSVYCLTGLVTGGRRANPVSGPTFTPYLWQLDLSTDAQHDGGDLQRVRGVDVASGAPFELSDGFVDGGRVGQLLTFTMLDGPDPFAVALTSVSTRLYRGALPTGELRFGTATFAVTEVTVTPEPSTYALLGTGLLSLGIMAARRRRRAEG